MARRARRLRCVARLDVGGVTFSVRADGAPRQRAPLAALLRRWSRALRAPRGPVALSYDLLLRPRRARIVRDGRSLFSARRAEDVLAVLELELHWQSNALTAAAPLHAAAVVHPRGAALLVGPSGAGKSTLALALVERGLAYLGEEHAFVDARGDARGFPRALRPDGRAPVLPRPDQVARAAPVALVVLLDPARAPGAGPAPVAPAAGAAALAGALLRRATPADLATLAALAARVPIVRLAREGVAAAADDVQGLLERPGR